MFFWHWVQAFTIPQWCRCSISEIEKEAGKGWGWNKFTFTFVPWVRILVSISFMKREKESRDHLWSCAASLCPRGQHFPSWMLCNPLSPHISAQASGLCSEPSVRRSRRQPIEKLAGTSVGGGYEMSIMKKRKRPFVFVFLKYICIALREEVRRRKR